MTAEIAILNKSAAVLAADSAVTIGSGGSAKIFNTANKIFEIGTANPIGLMVFNRLDYMDLPIEVLAKEYRKLRQEENFKTVRECMEDFLAYLQDEVPFNGSVELQNFHVLVWDSLNSLRLRFDEDLYALISETRKVLVSKFNGVLKRTVEGECERLRKLDTVEGFESVLLSEEQRKIVDTISDQMFREMQLTKVNRDLLHRYVRLRASQAELTSLLTGLVFSGFGSDDLCPSLIHVEMDGMLFGKLKAIEIRDVDIGREGPAAEILGFAQDDMVQSFVHGVDPVFRDYSRTVLRDGIEASARLILEPILKDEDKLNKFITSMNAEFTALGKELGDKSDQFVENRYTRQVKDMVRSMPKEELSTLAESLIDITSLKRKVTRDRETVGGEVDVAVISRSEGLIWVKRKHYFPAELNSRFFHRISDQ